MYAVDGCGSAAVRHKYNQLVWQCRKQGGCRILRFTSVNINCYRCNCQRSTEIDSRIEMLLLRFYFMVRAPEHIFHDVRRKKPVSVTALLLVNLDFYSDEKLPGKYLLFPPPHGVLGPHLFLLASEATRQTPLHLSDQNIKTPPSQRDDPLSSAGAYLVPGTWYLVPFFSETRYLFLRWARCRARHACKYTQKQVAGLFTGHAWPHPLVGSGSFQKLRGRVGCSKGSVGLG